MQALIGTIGGYVGLLLGASLVNIGKINSFLIDKCVPEQEDQEGKKVFDKVSKIHVTPVQDIKYSRSWQDRY